MQIWILRPEAEIHEDGAGPLSLQPMMQAVISVLVLADGAPVRVGTLKELLWDADAEPEKLTSRLTTIIARLRRVLGQERLVHSGDSYRLALQPGDFVDLFVARKLVDQARTSDPRTAATRTRTRSSSGARRCWPGWL